MLAYLHQIGPAVHAAAADVLDDLVRELVEDMNRNIAVERGFDRSGVTLPHLAIGEDDVGAAKESEMEMFLVVFLGELDAV